MRPAAPHQPIGPGWPGVPACLELPSFLDRHALYESSAEVVDVVALLVDEHRSRLVASDQVDRHLDPAVRALGDCVWLSGGIDRGPLALPVFADSVAADDTSALPAVGPVDVEGHGG